MKYKSYAEMHRIETEAAKVAFNKLGHILPKHVCFRGCGYETIDAEAYQGLIIINLVDGDDILRADASLCKALMTCPTCGHTLKEEQYK